MIKEADLDGDGSINYEASFERSFLCCSSGCSSVRVDPSLLVPLDRLRSLFTSPFLLSGVCQDDEELALCLRLL